MIQYPLHLHLKLFGLSTYDNIITQRLTEEGDLNTLTETYSSQAVYILGF